MGIVLSLLFFAVPSPDPLSPYLPAVPLFSQFPPLCSPLSSLMKRFSLRHPSTPRAHYLSGYASPNIASASKRPFFWCFAWTFRSILSPPNFNAWQAGSCPCCPLPFLRGFGQAFLPCPCPSPASSTPEFPRDPFIFPPIPIDR